jgi:hypothetical protein
MSFSAMLRLVGMVAQQQDRVRHRAAPSSSAARRRTVGRAQANARLCGGDTCSGKAFRCVLETPIGDTSRQKALRYQQTA